MTAGKSIYFLLVIVDYFATVSPSDLTSETGSTESCGDFRCSEGGDCIPVLWFCDGIGDCDNGSDEVAFHGQDFSGDILCSSDNISGRCLLPKSMICDDTKQCADGVDECLCDKGQGTSYIDKQCFRCLRHPQVVIPISKLCDSKFDCPDLSDECLCDVMEAPKICQRIEWGLDGAINGEILCEEEHDSNSTTLDKICKRNGTRKDCISDQDMEHCRQGSLDPLGRKKTTGKNEKILFDCVGGGRRRAVKCNGVPECERYVGMEECDSCSDKAGFCDLVNIFMLGCNVTGNWSELPADKLCDGVADCDSRADELDCKHRYYCNDSSSGLISIEEFKYCDHHEDCFDGSDEPFNCSFKCNENATEIIHRSRVCDETQDCQEGADECQPGCISDRSAFSDEKSMIKDKAVLVVAWIISVTSVVGNVAVAGTTIFRMCPLRKLVVEEKITRILFLSLSISDLLVGVYTLIICIVSTTSTTDYCLQDSIWRSGDFCKLSGVLLVVGSEQSVLTVVTVTLTRVIAMRRPFSRPSLRSVCLIQGVTWCISILIATLPLNNHLQDTFVERVWFEPNLLFGTIDQYQVTKLTQLMLPLRNGLDGEIGSWSLFEKLARKLNLTVGRRYGFYSAHSVCLPRLFSKSNTRGWWYGFVIAIINFLAFLIMLFGYVLIYRARITTEKKLDSTAENGKGLKELSLKLQIKILIIVFTDFLCWVPVCVMVFIQISGEKIPRDAYLPVALIILPINSALNPFIYSAAPDYLWVRTHRFGTRMRHSVSSRISMSISASRASRSNVNDLPDTAQVRNTSQLT